MEIIYQPHPLYPPLHDMDIYSYHEGEGLLLKGLRPFKLPLINDLLMVICLSLVYRVKIIREYSYRAQK